MRILAWDCETHLIKPGMLAPKMVCASFSDDGKTAIVLRAKEACEYILNALRSDAIIVGANIAYDFGVLCAEVPSAVPEVFKAYQDGRVYDVQINTALHAVALGRLGCDINTGLAMRGRYSLAECVKQWLGREDAKSNAEFRLKYHELDAQPMSEWPEVAVQYAKDDAINTWLVFDAQVRKAQNVGEEVEGKGITHGAFQARAAWAMHLATVWGLAKDLSRVEKLQAELEALRHEAFERFTKVGFLRQDGTENQAAVREAVEKAYGENTPRTEKGQIQISRPVLLDSGDALLREYAEAGAVDKILDTYLPALRSGGARYDQARANVLLATGRSSYEGLVQTMPRKGGVRECFVSTPGYTMCSVDYAALELSTLAQVHLWLFDRSAMAEAINADQDLHSKLGAQLAGQTYEQFVARVKAKDGEAKELRQMAKAANFGFGGMMGAAKFVIAKRKEGLLLCVSSGKYKEPCNSRRKTSRSGDVLCANCLEFAEALREAWFNTWPEMRLYFKWVTSHSDMNSGVGAMVSPGSGYIRGGLGASDGANHPFQHLASMGAKHALFTLSELCYTNPISDCYGGRPLLFIHDEIIAEFPDASASDAAKEMAAVMVSSMREYVPDVKVKAEPALMKRWYKDAEMVVDSKGRLMPWEPKV